MKASTIFKDFEIRMISPSSVTNYVELLRECFPKLSVSNSYLEWLYFENPLGSAIGFDAIIDGRVVGHYACVPTKIFGLEKKALVSVNTATSPRFQGRGLFKVLAVKTYELASNSSFACVIGVANNYSFKSFIRHLEFVHLGNLDLRFGFLNRSNEGSRIYSQADLEWRCQSPLNKFSWKPTNNKFANIKTKILPGLNLHSLVKTDFCDEVKSRRKYVGLTLDWQHDKKPLIYLPKSLKPSPLALIFKSLDGTESSILKSWSFPDFDAY
jgi:hypothetical protein